MGSEFENWFKTGHRPGIIHIFILWWLRISFWWLILHFHKSNNEVTDSPLGTPWTVSCIPTFLHFKQPHVPPQLCYPSLSSSPWWTHSIELSLVMWASISRNWMHLDIFWNLHPLGHVPTWLFGYLSVWFCTLALPVSQMLPYLYYVSFLPRTVVFPSVCYVVGCLVRSIITTDPICFITILPWRSANPSRFW